MTVYLPPKNEKGECLDVSYCSACMICKANGYCYQNRDYDELALRLGEADRIVIAPDSPEGELALHRILHPEETWFPKRRVAFLEDCYARFTGSIAVSDRALLGDVRRLFIHAERIDCEKERT